MDNITKYCLALRKLKALCIAEVVFYIWWSYPRSSHSGDKDLNRFSNHQKADNSDEYFVVFSIGTSTNSSLEQSQKDVSVRHLGPVVQSIVSLTSSLRVISLTVLADSIYNILIFFAEKMSVAFALQKLLTFFQQNISAYLPITRCKF